MKVRAIAAAAVAAVVVLMSTVTAGSASPRWDTPPEQIRAPPALVHKFVSAPDLFNGDIGDVRSSPHWRHGMPNSWNTSWASNVRNILGQLAGHDADSYLVAGDMVEGHWHKDKRGSGVFGPGRTKRERLARITNAGNVYYREWLRFWREAGVRLNDIHTAVGDHEVGDNPWVPGKIKYDAFERFKNVYARNFTKVSRGMKPRYVERPIGTKFDDTAYATYLAPTVLLVTVDVFNRTRVGVNATVKHGQLAWLDSVLAATPDDVTVLVQGHTPVLAPVRHRSSSGLIMDAGQNEESAFWKVLDKHGVALYLAGEVHDFTAVGRGVRTPVQLSHGGYGATGRTDYVVGQIFSDGSVEIEAFTIDRLWRSSVALWQTNRTYIPAHLRTASSSRSVGKLGLDASGAIASRTGCLAEWTGRNDSCSAASR